jgi:hypothetical protein
MKRSFFVVELTGASLVGVTEKDMDGAVSKENVGCCVTAATGGCGCACTTGVAEVGLKT